MTGEESDQIIEEKQNLATEIPAKLTTCSRGPTCQWKDCTGKRQPCTPRIKELCFLYGESKCPLIIYYCMYHYCQSHSLPKVAYIHALQEKESQCRVLWLRRQTSTGGETGDSWVQTSILMQTEAPFTCQSKCLYSLHLHSFAKVSSKHVIQRCKPNKVIEPVINKTDSVIGSLFKRIAALVCTRKAKLESSYTLQTNKT